MTNFHEYHTLTSYEEQRLSDLRYQVTEGIRLTDKDLRVYQMLSEKQRVFRFQLISHITKN